MKAVIMAPNGGACGPGVDFAASRDGGYIFPAFLPAFDAVVALVHILSLMAESETRLSWVVSELANVRIVHETVVTP